MNILSIDPGEATGWSLWVLDDFMPMKRLEYGVITGGVRGFSIWFDFYGRFEVGEEGVIVFEQFRLGGDVVNPNIEAKAIEGALIYARESQETRASLVFNQRSDKRQVRDDVLKAAGLWITGKPVGWTDGRDVNDSQIHALAYAKSVLRHRPTLERYFSDSVLEGLERSRRNKSAKT